MELNCNVQLSLHVFPKKSFKFVTDYCLFYRKYGKFNIRMFRKNKIAKLTIVSKVTHSVKIKVEEKADKQVAFS